MKKWWFCIWWFSLAAQAQKADSLVGVLKKASRDTNKVNTLYELGRAYWREGYDSLARLYCDQSIALAQQLHYPKGEAKAHLQLVRIEFEYLTDLKTAYAHLDMALKNAQSIPDKSLEGQVYLRRAQLYESFFEKQPQVNPLLNKALRLFIDANDLVWQGAVYAEMATLLTNEGKYAEAVDLMLKARRLQEKANDITALRSTVPNLGTFYAALGRYDDALQCYKDAETIANKLNDLRLRAYVIGQRADIHEKQKQYPQALKAFQEAVKIHEMTRSTQWLPRTYGRLGGVYLQLKEYKKALYYTTIADSIYKNQIDSKESLEHVCQINFGNIFLAQKQYHKVVGYATTGVEWASSSQPPLRRELAEYHRQLSEAYEHLGKPALALTHFKQFKAESDSLINNDVLQKTMVSAMTYEFEKKQQGDKLRIQTLENEKLTQTRNILLGLSAIGLLGLGFVLWYNRRLKLKNQELSRKNREIEEALFKGQKIERKRVASELHDNLNTKLAALRWHLEAMQTDELNGFNLKIHDKLLEMANDVYADVRLISHNMLPAELETQGLAAALQHLVNKLTINTKTQFHLVTTHAATRLPSEVEHQLYNIALELVNNVLKHAHASEVWISLSQTETQLSLTVSDNGVGMPQDVSSEGMGMKNLTSRVEALMGDLTIESEPAKGTKVSINLLL